MQNYWNNVSQPVNYQNRPVKKEEKNEKLKKAVTYTLGALAGVGAAALIGYGIINKSQGKKVVDKAKDAASEVAKKGKDSTKKSSSQINNLTFQCLNKIIQGKALTPKEIQSEINILTAYKANSLIPQVNKSIAIYINLLQEVLDKNSSSLEIKEDDYKDIFSDTNKASIKISDVLNLTKQENNLMNELEKYNLDFDDLQLINDGKIVKDGHEIELTETNDDVSVFSCLRHNIYYNDANKDIYISKNNKCYKINISELASLNPVEEIKGDKFLNPSQITFIDKEASIEDLLIGGENIKCIKGVKKAEADTDTDLYIKVQDLTAQNIAMIMNTDGSKLDKKDDILNAIKDYCQPEIIGQVLADGSLKDKLVDTGTGTPKDAGNTLITGWVETNKADNGKITSALNEIKECGDNSVGAAFVSAIKDNCDGETIKNILSGLFESKPDMEIKVNTKEQRLLDILFRKINLIEFKNFIKENKIKTYTLQDEQYKESVGVYNNEFKMKIKTYTKAYFSSKDGTYNDKNITFDKYLLQQCGVDTLSVNGQSYADIAKNAIGVTGDGLQEIKLSVDDYEANALVNSDKKSTGKAEEILTDKAKEIILRHSTGDNKLDSLNFTKIEYDKQSVLFSSSGKKSDPAIIIGGSKFKYYVDGNVLHIRYAQKQTS